MLSYECHSSRWQWLIASFIIRSCCTDHRQTRDIFHFVCSIFLAAVHFSPLWWNKPQWSSTCNSLVPVKYCILMTEVSVCDGQMHPCGRRCLFRCLSSALGPPTRLRCGQHADGWLEGFSFGSAHRLGGRRGASGAAAQTEAGLFKCSLKEIFLIIKKGLRAVDDSETRTAVRGLRRIEITTKPEIWWWCL